MPFVGPADEVADIFVQRAAQHDVRDAAFFQHPYPVVFTAGPVAQPMPGPREILGQVAQQRVAKIEKAFFRRRKPGAVIGNVRVQPQAARVGGHPTGVVQPLELFGGIAEGGVGLHLPRNPPGSHDRAARHREPAGVSCQQHEDARDQGQQAAGQAADRRQLRWRQRDTARSRRRIRKRRYRFLRPFRPPREPGVQVQHCNRRRHDREKRDRPPVPQAQTGEGEPGQHQRPAQIGEIQRERRESQPD